MKRLLQLAFLFILSLAIAVSIILWWPVPARYAGPPSDHFDGKYFFNPTGFSHHSFWHVMGWILRRHPAPWPQWIPQKITPRLPISLRKQDIAVTFINHATTLVQLKDFNVLTDPIWSERASPFSWIGPKRVRDPGLPFKQLPYIHAVLISHNHYDHMDEKTIQRLDEKFHPLFIVPLGDRARMVGFGVKNIIELDWWQSMELRPKISVTMTPVQHFSARWMNDRNLSLWGSYVLTHGKKRIFFSGDTGYSYHFQDIHKKLGPMDVALLGIGAYKPRSVLHASHMNPAEAVKAHQDLHAQRSLGIHFGTFQLTDEAIDAPAHDLHAALEAASLNKNDFIAPEAGATYYFTQ